MTEVAPSQSVSMALVTDLGLVGDPGDEVVHRQFDPPPHQALEGKGEGRQYQDGQDQSVSCSTAHLHSLWFVGRQCSAGRVSGTDQGLFHFFAFCPPFQCLDQFEGKIHGRARSA